MNIRSGLKQFIARLSTKRIPTPAEGEPVREQVTDAGYFEEVSIRYATVQLVCIMLLAVFAAVSLLTNSALLSSENLLYFAKDMATSMSQREGAARDTLVYTADEDNRYALYRDGLAVLGGEKLTVFTATGREAYSKYLAYATPRLCPSGRYLLAYDLGGKAYSLYNSFDCVESGMLTTPIRGVAVANDGSYCIITDGVEHASLVTLYNERFREVAYYNINEYTICADLTEDGSRLLLASLSSQSGRMTTHIMLSTPGKQTPDAEWTVSDAYPVAAAWLENGNIMLLSTDFVAWYDGEGKELKRHSFLTDDVRSYRTTDEGCILLCRANSYDAATRILAFDKNGEEMYNIVIDTRVTDVAMADGRLAVLTDGEARFYDENAPLPYHAVPLTGSYDQLLVCDERDLLLCGDAKAVAVRTNARKEEK